MERPKIQLIKGDDTKTLQGYIYELWSYIDQLEAEKKDIGINIDDPYNYMLINCKGDTYTFNPNSRFGEQLYDFIMPNLKKS